MQPLANLAPVAHARLGTTLSGKWRLDKVLGSGGVATVFLATHRNQSRAALKLLHPEQAQNPVVRDRFVREGYTANSIAHPGVVRVLDDDVSEDGLPYLVMELLEGETLEDRACRHGDRLPAGDVLALTDQLLDVLVAAHDRRVVHRDLKPDNLFLTRDGRLKVLDFGIARLTEAFPQHDVTAVGTLLGTPSFMPPEQARSRWEEVDAQSDIYAVGATMFNLLTGRLVREADTLTEQLGLAIHEPAPKLASIDPSIDRAVCEIVDKALAYEKRGRFADARTMQLEVARVRELIPAPLTTSVSPAPEDLGSKRTLASPDARTLLESGRASRAVRATSETKPITIAIERRLAAVVVLALLAGVGVLIWLSPRLGEAKHDGAEASSTTSKPPAPQDPTTVRAPAQPPALLPVAAPGPNAAAGAASATPVAGPAHTVGGKSSFAGAAPAASARTGAASARVGAAPAASARTAPVVPGAASTTEGPSAPAAPGGSADPFSKRY